jgi:hypothetical protein
VHLSWLGDLGGFWDETDFHETRDTGFPARPPRGDPFECELTGLCGIPCRQKNAVIEKVRPGCRVTRQSGESGSERRRRRSLCGLGSRRPEPVWNGVGQLFSAAGMARLSAQGQGFSPHAQKLAQVVAPQRVKQEGGKNGAVALAARAVVNWRIEASRLRMAAPPRPRRTSPSRQAMTCTRVRNSSGRTMPAKRMKSLR